MVIEVEPFIDCQPADERKYSRYKPLNDKLKAIETNFRVLLEEGVTSEKVADYIGFDKVNREARISIIDILQEAIKKELFTRKNGDSPRTKYRFNANRLLIARALIDFWMQEVSWRNMPFVLYHYLNDEKLREEIRIPNYGFDNRQLIKRGNAKIAHEKFKRMLGSELIDLQNIDLDKITIMSEIPAEFTGKTFHIELSKRALNHQQIGAFFWFLWEKPDVFRPEESINSTRLVNSGFTLADADTILKFYAKNTGHEFKNLDVLDYDWGSLKFVLERLYLQTIDISLEIVNQLKLPNTINDNKDIGRRAWL